MTDHFTTCHVEAALCAWEWYIEGVRDKMDHVLINGIEAHREQNGIVAARHAVIDWAEYIDTASKIARQAGYEGAFDFDFVPTFLAFAVDFKTMKIRGGWNRIAEIMGEDPRYHWYGTY